MTIKRANLQQAFDLSEALAEIGMVNIIGGGCARDIFFGLEPKDVDIVIPAGRFKVEHVSDIPMQVPEFSMDDVADFLRDRGVDFQKFYIYNGVEDRIIGVFKLTGSDIDVILYDVATVEEAYQAFDFNINQFVIANVARGIDEATVRYVGDTSDNGWYRLKAIRQDFKPKREEYIREKHHALVSRDTLNDGGLMAWVIPNESVSVLERPVGGELGIY